MPPSADSKPFDAVVIGTGFGGAVTACRLVEAGLRVCVLERGRVYEENDFPKYPTEDLFATNDRQDVIPPAPDFSRWLWKWDRGIYDVRELQDVVSVQAAGYGGGSLIYANVHLRPPREVFDERWPDEYRDGRLDSYFDLAAYMLKVSTVPQRLMKTLQLERGARTLAEGTSPAHWFLTPLAVNFEERFDEKLSLQRAACDMRGRCCIGCDRQAKNTLDLNYLAYAERGGAEIHTLAEVTRIARKNAAVFAVTYNNLLVRSEDEAAMREAECTVEGKYVFLCAGAINTTELLLRNAHLLSPKQREHPERTPLGSHYCPNTDSLAAVFECDEPHEADYGPTITSAVLHRSTAKGDFRCSLDFSKGCCPRGGAKPAAGMMVRCDRSGVTAELAHDPILDWGDWHEGDAVGTLVFSDNVPFGAGDELVIGPDASVKTRSALVEKTHWFLAQDGGYPPDLEPLVGIFRSPLWLRRNRFIESASKLSGPIAPPRRSARRHLRLAAFTDALRGTGAPAGSADGFLSRSFKGNPLAPSDTDVATFFPEWFVTAAGAERRAFVDQASAFALPMLGRLLDGLASTVAKTLDADMLSRFNVDLDPNDERKDVFIRGMLRQGLQVLAGSEAEIAARAARQLLNPVPSTPGQLLDLLGDLLLWLLAYKVDHGHTAIILTMGRDLYRGRLYLEKHEDKEQNKDEDKNGDHENRDKSPSGEFRLKARLPNRLVDTSSVVQERVLRELASKGWNGELRTNPAWAALGRRLTVHSQGGCPMGSDATDSVTKPTGEVHDCKGLYVMDAAAFPMSVGVNPSATVLAVAEYKIEQFIRWYKNEPQWETADRENVAAWLPQPAVLDPLNHGVVPSENDCEQKVVALTFTEYMSGLFKPVRGFQLIGEVEHNADLKYSRKTLDAFRDAENRGVLIRVALDATVSDLARLISTDHTVPPVTIALGGTVTIDNQSFAVKQDRSFLEMFVRPPDDPPPLRRFFRYKVVFDDEESKTWELVGRKVLRNDLGQDLWLDVATLYFEMFTDGALRRRGILRLSFNDFLQIQLKSSKITGTPDPTRQIWALLAFYRYFARELSCVYAGRAGELMKVFSSAMTGINV